MEAPPIQYVSTNDGYNIAYTVAGSGCPIVYMHPFGHVQNDWRSPATGPWLRGLSQRLRLVHYDSRGQGMSTRGLQDLAPDHYERDIEALAEKLPLEKFVLFGSFWFGHVAIRYALKHPGRLAALVLLHCQTQIGPPLIGPELARQNWDVFLETQVTAHGWTAEQRLTAIEHFRQSMTRTDWLHREAVFSGSDVTELLSQLRLPVLVLHARDNNRANPETSIHLAAQIQDARLTLIDGFSQLGDASSGVQAIEAFLAHLPTKQESAVPDARTHAPDGLSQREVEVLRLLATGKSNAQIASELVISQNTVIRHVSNIFTKTGVVNRTEAAAYAHRNGLL